MAKTRKSRDPATNTPLNPPGTPFERKQRELEGDEPREEQQAFIEQHQTDDLGEITPTDVYAGELAAGVDDDLPNDPDTMELLHERELRAEETASPFEAIEEGMPYVPPTDPPITPDTHRDRADAEVASGMGPSALSEPYDRAHHSDFELEDDEMSARIRDALRADSSTTRYADELRIATRAGIVLIGGIVDDLVDSENIIAVAQYVAGVVEVRDRMQLRRS